VGRGGDGEEAVEKKFREIMWKNQTSAYSIHRSEDENGRAFGQKRGEREKPRSKQISSTQQRREGKDGL